MRGWMVAVGISGAIGAGMGAVVSHVASGNAGAATLISIAMQYQLWHALALALVAVLGWNGGSRLLTVTAWAFLLGQLFFCGSLYLLAFTGQSLGAVTPLGGTLLIGGWLLLALHGWVAMRGRGA